jgi:hypothetical protein
MKRFSIFFLVTFITLTLFVFGVSAQADTHRASVEKLLILMNQDQLMEQMFPQIKQMVMQQFEQMDLTEEQTRLMEKYFDKIFNVMKEEMSWDKMKDDFILLYMSVYTEAEVNELIDFYESPIGRKTLEKLPLLMEKSVAISQKYPMNMMPKIQEITMEMMNEVQAATEEE